MDAPNAPRPVMVGEPQAMWRTLRDIHGGNRLAVACPPEQRNPGKEQKKCCSHGERGQRNHGWFTPRKGVETVVRHVLCGHVPRKAGYG